MVISILPPSEQIYSHTIKLIALISKSFSNEPNWTIKFFYENITHFRYSLNESSIQSIQYWGKRWWKKQPNLLDRSDDLNLRKTMFHIFCCTMETNSSSVQIDWAIKLIHINRQEKRREKNVGSSHQYCFLCEEKTNRKNISFPKFFFFFFFEANFCVGTMNG